MKAKMNKRVIVSILVVVLIGVISGGVYVTLSQVFRVTNVEF